MSFYISDKTVSIELWERKIEYDKIAFALFQLSETFEMRIANDSKTIIDNRVNGKPIDNVQRVSTEVTVKPLPWIIDNFAYAQSVLDSTAKCVNSLFNEYGINLNPNWTEINKHWSKRIERLNTAYTNAVSEAVNAQIHNQQVRFQQAYNEELSIDSGLGFGIISNSLVSHLLYAAQSASKEVKDHERALKYANENSGENFADSMLALINAIYPFYMDNIEQNLIKIIGEYYAYIVSLFSKELGYIYDDIGKQFNIDDSFSILDNGEISKDTLLSALEKNPNNGVVIGYAIQYGYLDRELCEYGHNSTPMFLRRLKNWAIARLSEIYKAGKLFNKPVINDENRIIINGLMDFYRVKYPKLEKCQDWQDILMGAFTQDVAKHLTEMGEIAVAKSNMLIPVEFDKLARSGKKFYLNNESKSLFVCLYHELYFNGAYSSASFLDLTAPFSVEDIDRNLQELNDKLQVRSVELTRQAEIERKEREEKQKELQQQKEIRDKKIKKYALIVISIVTVIILFVVLLNSVIIPTSKYNNAVNLMNAGKYEEAIEAFEELDGYKDSDTKINECKYQSAMVALNAKNYTVAYDTFTKLEAYSDSSFQAKQCAKEAGDSALSNKQYQEAVNWYEKADRIDDVRNAEYLYVKSHLNSTDKTTYVYLTALKNASYKDAKSIYDELYKLHFEYIINDSPTDFTTNKTTFQYVSSYYGGAIYIHVRVTGGYPGQKVWVETDGWHMDSAYIECNGEWNTLTDGMWLTYGQDSSDTKITIKVKYTTIVEECTVTVYK